MERYISHFGALNHEVEVGEHRLVLIDAPGLVDEEAQRVASGMDYPRWAEIRPKGTIAFVHSLAASRYFNEFDFPCSVSSAHEK